MVVTPCHHAAIMATMPAPPLWWHVAMARVTPKLFDPHLISHTQNTVLFINIGKSTKIIGMKNPQDFCQVLSLLPNLYSGVSQSTFGVPVARDIAVVPFSTRHVYTYTLMYNVALYTLFQLYTTTVYTTYTVAMYTLSSCTPPRCIQTKRVPVYTYTHSYTMFFFQQGVRFDPDLPQTIRLEFAKSNTKVSKPKQVLAPQVLTQPPLVHPLTGRK